MKNFTIFLLIFSVSFGGMAAQKCQNEYEKLRKIQKKMNQGYKESSGNRLREKERDARKIYQDCRQGKTNKKRKKNKNNKKD